MSSKAYDRFGRELSEGDLVVQLTQGTIIWRVTRAAPSLSAQAPAGMVELELIAVSASGVPGGQPLGDLVRIRDAADMDARPIAPPSFES